VRLVKFEKKACSKCISVQNFLDDKGIKPEKIDVENYDDLDFIAKYVEMALPVVVLLDENDQLVQKSVGFEPAELEEIVSKL
jgi:glutaredoxin